MRSGIAAHDGREGMDGFADGCLGSKGGSESTYMYGLWMWMWMFILL